jgi:hypothetical protein
VSESEGLLEQVENEIRWRLSEKPCPKCGRGANAHNIAPTALSQWLATLRRGEKEEQEEQRVDEMNPLALVATVRKLPADHPKRGELLELLDGHIIVLQEAVKSLKEESV